VGGVAVVGTARVVGLLQMGTVDCSGINSAVGTVPRHTAAEDPE
jgi:hypothetical protein